MKIKFLIPVIFSIVIGFLLGQVFFNEYDDKSLTVFNEGESVYFIQLGVYKELENIKQTVSNYDDFLIELENDGYHVYAGITKIKKQAELIKDYYESLGNNVYIKERKLTNNTFLNILEEYDKITTIASNNDDLISIERIVLSNYEEMILQDESND